MSDEPRKVPNWKNLSFQLGKFIFPVGKCQKRSLTDFGDYCVRGPSRLHTCAVFLSIFSMNCLEISLESLSLQKKRMNITDNEPSYLCAIK